MNSVLGLIYSLPFVVGLAAGIIGQRLYCYAQARHLDKVHPLPTGRRKVGGIDQAWLGGLLAVAVLGYVLLQVGQTEQRYVHLADAVAECQSDLIISIGDSRKVNDTRDNLSEEQRALGLMIDNATADLVRRVLSPPPEIAYLPPEGRRVWTSSVQKEYDQLTEPWRARSAQIVHEVQTLTNARRPLPDPRCAHP